MPEILIHERISLVQSCGGLEEFDIKQEKELPTNINNNNLEN